MDEPIVEIRNFETPPITLILSRAVHPIDDEFMLHFMIAARGEWGRVETPVHMWLEDDLGTFFSSLAEEFRGWRGARTWEALDGSLTISAEHRSRGHIHLTWTLSGADIEHPWNFSCTTVHGAGEDMRTLAVDVRQFIRTAAE